MRRLSFLIAALFAVLGTCWALASPVGSAPDDGFHLASTWCAWGDAEGRCRTVGNDPLTVEVPKPIAYADFCGNSSTQTFEECVDTAPPRTRVDWLNDGLYPPAYYRVNGLLVTPHVEVSVLAMRLVNVAMASLLLLGALLLAPPLLTRAYLLVFAFASVPLGLFLIASTNPSSWMVIGAINYWLFAAAWLSDPPQPSTRKRIALIVLLLVSGSLLTLSRADGAVLALAVTTAVVVFALKPSRSRTLLTRIAPLALVALIATVTLLTSSQLGVHASGMKGAQRGDAGYLPFLDATDLDTASLWVNNILEYPRLVIGAFGEAGIGSGPLGQMNVSLPGINAFVGVLALGAIVLLGLGDMWRRKGYALLVLAAPLVLFPLVVLGRGGNIVGQAVQPRYVLPALLAFLATLLLSRPQSPPWPSGRSVGIAFTAALALTMTVSVAAMLGAYRSSLLTSPPHGLILAAAAAASVAYFWACAQYIARCGSSTAT